MMEENAPACGTFTPQGLDASTRKKSAPVSLTVRKTSESGSLPYVLREAGGADLAEASTNPSARGTVDDTASDKDVRSWACTMPKHTLCALAYPPDAPRLTTTMETRPWKHSIKRPVPRKFTMPVSCRRFLRNGARLSRQRPGHA